LRTKCQGLPDENYRLQNSPLMSLELPSSIGLLVLRVPTKPHLLTSLGLEAQNNVVPPINVITIELLTQQSSHTK